jgi:NDP-sugar pyrophosphorylase family protein
MKAIILAGGLGTRLKPFTEVIPKPLLPIGESSVLEIQILSLKKHGFKDIIIATNHMAEYVEAFLGNGDKYGVHLQFSKEREPLGTCGPVSLVREQLSEPFFLMNGDILTTLDFGKAYSFACRHVADLVVLTKEIRTPFSFGKVVSKDDFLVGLEEKPNFRFEVLAGIYVLKPALFRLIPKGVLYGIDDLIKDMLAADMKVGKYLMQEYWLDIGQMESYEKAQEAYKAHFGHLKSRAPKS